MNEGERTVDAVIVGAGFSGLYLLHRLRDGQGLDVQVYDAAGDVGGTWWWNRYPGARCDIESVDYSYSFSPELEQEWTWSERYATQPEILRYVGYVADRFDLRRSIRFETRVTAATWRETDARWLVQTDDGERVAARFLVMAVGCLSAAKDPEIPGIDRFAGPTYHTGRWPHEDVELAGLRVGVIGTGSSAIQSIPILADEAAELVVFQRTPNFAMPAHNATYDPAWLGAFKRRYREHRAATRDSHGGVLVTRNEESALAADPEEREARYREAWASGTLFGILSAYGDLLIDEDANETAAEFVRARIREIVRDPATAEKLSPRSYPFGTKRACLATGYYETFNRPNVRLVDLRDTPIVEIDAAGVRTSAEHHPLDVLVFATGFDAMTGAFLGPEIRGRAGTLAEHWAEGPRTYLGIASAGFPNLFLITGPGSPSVLTNMLVSIEQHVDWTADCIAHLRAEDRRFIEATPEAEATWTEHVTELAGYTLFPRAASWYMGANVPGKPRVFMPYLGGVASFRETCDAVAADGYRGFVLG